MRISWHFILLKLLLVLGIILGIISLSQKSNSQWLSPHIVTSIYFLSLLCLIPLLFYYVYNAFKKAKFGFQIFIFVLLLFLLALCLDYIFNTHIFAERKYLRENIFTMLIFVIILLKFIIDCTFQFGKRAVALILILFSFAPFTYNFLYNLYLDPYELFFKREGVLADSSLLKSLERIYHGGYDAIIVGTSHEIGIKNEIFDKILGDKYNFTHSVTLDSPGITDHTQITLINMALRTNSNIKLVYFGYYLPGNFIGTADTNYHEAKTYLYDYNRFNDLKFYYENSNRDMKNQLKYSRYNSTVVQDWFPFLNYIFNHALSSYINRGCGNIDDCYLYKSFNINAQLTVDEENSISEYIQKLDKTLSEYQNVKFIFYSTLWHSNKLWYSINISESYRYNLIKRILMLGHKNIEIFMPRSDFVLERPDLFEDYFHQHPYIHTLYLKYLKSDMYIVDNVSELDDYYSWLNQENLKAKKQFPDRWNYNKFESYYNNQTFIFNDNAVTIWNLPDDNNLLIRIKNCYDTSIHDYTFKLEASHSLNRDFRLYRDDYKLDVGWNSNVFTKGNSCYIEQGLPYKDWTEHYTATSVRLNLKYHDTYLLKDVVLNLTPTTWRPPAPIQEIIDKKEDYIVLQSDFDKYLIKNN